VTAALAFHIDHVWLFVSRAEATLAALHVEAGMFDVGWMMKCNGSDGRGACLEM
jgi:hypothetical protein